MTMRLVITWVIQLLTQPSTKFHLIFHYSECNLGYPEKNTRLSQVIAKLDHIILNQNTPSHVRKIKLKCLVMIGT